MIVFSDKAVMSQHDLLALTLLSRKNMSLNVVQRRSMDKIGSSSKSCLLQFHFSFHIRRFSSL